MTLNPYAGKRGPKNPDDYRIQCRNSRHYWDTLPADDLRPEGPMEEKKRTKQALPAQSTVLKSIPSDFAYWAAKQTAEHAVTTRTKWENLDDDDAVAIVAKGYPKALDRASERGTGVHEYLEARLEGRDPSTTWMNEDAKKYVPILDQFIRQQEPEIVLAEVVGIGTEHACTTDAVLRLPNLDVETSVADWKSRNDTVKKPHVVYDKEVAQLGANLDVRYWIVEDIETGEPERVPIPEGLGAVLVTFTTTSYAVHLVDPEPAIEAFRNGFRFWQELKKMPKAVKGVQTFELELATGGHISEDDAVTVGEHVPEFSDKLTETHEAKGNDVDFEQARDLIRGRIVNLIDNGHETVITSRWPNGVPGISAVETHDELAKIAKACDKAEADVGAPFTEPNPEPVNNHTKPAAEKAPEPAPLREGEEAGQDDIDTVRTGWQFLEPDDAKWLATIAETAGNLSLTERNSERRLLIAWALVRLGTAGWGDNELVEACLDHAHALDREPGIDDVGNVLARMDVGAAKRFSATVTALIDDEIEFSVDQNERAVLVDVIPV